MKKISTSALAKKLNIHSKELFEILIENDCIEIENKGFIFKEQTTYLTEKGVSLGGEIYKSSKFGDYIVWPEDFNPFTSLNIEKYDYITISNIAKNFSLSAVKMNLIFSELGWIEKNIKGWKLTKFGENMGGMELIINKTGATYTKWPKEILENNSLLNSLGIKNDNVKEKIHDSIDDLNFREKFPTQYRTKDGHNVRSRGELVIDNALYDYGLAHAYERKLPIEEDVYSDFYIPAQNGSQAVYIEYWGFDDDEKYINRKNIKKNIYKKYEFKLIELENKHIDNLDDYLPRMLLEYGIKVD